MNTNDFALTILFGIKKVLAWIGIPSHMLDKMDELLFLIVIVIIAFIVAGIVHAVLVHLAKKILKRKRVGFFESMFKYGVFRKLTAIIPPLMVSALLPFAFSKDAILNTVGDELKKNKQLKNRPMKGFIQIFRVVFYCVVVIVIISILINKSPLNLITGLGAFTAVLMLVFKDTILGLVAGVMISEDDMLRIGDWIEMPQNNINGTVIDISLDVVKVQNFDNTIVTVPPYSLVSGSFINWRGMTDSGGRRIMREYTLKLDYIKPCTPEFLEKMKAFDKELAQFITEKQKQAADGKVANTDNPEGLVNGTIDTNLGLFRAYMSMYLRHHPFVSKELLLMVRTLPPVANGLPVQIYCFSSNKNWPSYESIQAEIMEHFVSVLPAFELYPFQNADARDMILSSYIESAKVDLSTLIGIPWHTTVTQSNPFDVEKQEVQDTHPKA